MKRSRFSEEQIIGILKEHQAGMSAIVTLRNLNQKAVSYAGIAASYEAGVTRGVRAVPFRNIRPRESRL